MCLEAIRVMVVMQLKTPRENKKYRASGSNNQRTTAHTRTGEKQESNYGTNAVREMKCMVNRKCLRWPLDLERGSPVVNESINEPVVVMVEPKISANVKEVGERAKVEILV
jgi:hypothetical protein